MITLHILQLLENEGFGTIDETLFWEKVPMDMQGVGILSTGGPRPQGNWFTQEFNLYSRGTDDLRGADKLEKICEYFLQNGIACTLPTVPNKSNKTYERAHITPVGTLTNLGEDEQDRLVWQWSYQVRYSK